MQASTGGQEKIYGQHKRPGVHVREYRNAQRRLDKVRGLGKPREMTMQVYSLAWPDLFFFL